MELPFASIHRGCAPMLDGLGGPVPLESASEHLASRLEVERVLLGAVPDSVAGVADITLAARS